jgi:pyrimidine deaminase RibD-like protein
MVTWSGCWLPAKHAKGDVLGAAAFELAGGAHAEAVAIQQHAQQGLGVVGGMAVPVITVGPVERTQVELVDHVEDEPGEVAVGQPVAQIRGQQEGLVAVAAQEVVRHALLYSLLRSYLM